jgi:hypothetical protein
LGFVADLEGIQDRAICGRRAIVLGEFDGHAIGIDRLRQRGVRKRLEWRQVGKLDVDCPGGGRHGQQMEDGEEDACGVATLQAPAVVRRRVSTL